MKIVFVSKNFKEKWVDLEKGDPEELTLKVDGDRCISCGSCRLACQLEHGSGPGNPGSFMPIKVERKEGLADGRTLTLPSACRHCKSPCEYYSPYNFWTICPKGKAEEQKILTCDFCNDRTQKGLWPACATRCTMKTIYFGRAQDVAFALREKRLREMGDVGIPD